MTPQEFKQARKNLNMTQKELAAKVGMSKQAISNYECGVTPINERIIFVMRCLANEK